jgi:hypothetical protein
LSQPRGQKEVMMARPADSLNLRRSLADSGSFTHSNHTFISDRPHADQVVVLLDQRLATPYQVIGDGG